MSDVTEVSASVEAWGFQLEREHYYVLHKPTRVIDKVKLFHREGTEDCKSPVIETETGHKFVATPENFQVLTTVQVQFVTTVNQVIVKLIGEIGVLAKALNLEPEGAIDLLGALLMRQAISLTRPTTRAITDAW
jgi:citrate lyase gamma subunit